MPTLRFSRKTALLPVCLAASFAGSPLMAQEQLEEGAQSSAAEPVTALQLSEPLHFGDYGGLPLKVLWALLDILTIVVLGSGLYLWLKRGATEVRT
ncbi:PepSY-associated TM helix domain-containing protein [Stutzerimonas stutzeri]|nr:PepSY-associated TM helix domain-containing protein [Stutzerimonas stutzeri]MDI9727804.1 PepSY-associated TM helix domain-containing protein [Stutzerimonas stutzeri]MDI9747466.1 PepSY-associated TM helix domain-containing protein [Stutzerimonas stutzeri]